MGQKVPELRDALTLLGSQLASMQHSKADRGKMERQLKSKVDRDEIDDIAARLAGDKDDDLDPTLVAKQQVPALKCLSCDRPLTLAPRTEAGIFPPAAYAGAAPSKVESLGRGPTPLDALYAAGARAAVRARAARPAAAGHVAEPAGALPAAERDAVAADEPGGGRRCKKRVFLVESKKRVLVPPAPSPSPRCKMPRQYSPQNAR